MRGTEMSADDTHAMLVEFKKAVNMTSNTLAAWLTTAESKKVGFKSTERSESVGHDSGEKIVVLLGKRQADFTGDDVSHARKVVGYIHRHLAQRPVGNITQTPWRYSLMNCGHDPLADR